MEKRINKHVYTWVGSFLFGGFGVDRFMRGQIKVGILKLIICFLPILLGRRIGINSLLLSFSVLSRAWSLFGNIRTIVLTHGNYFRYFRWLLTFLLSVSGSVWILIDWIIALIKLGKYEKNFGFNSTGKWDESVTKEGLEKAEKEAKEAEERREAEILRKQKEEEEWQEGIRTGKFDIDKANFFLNNGNRYMETEQYNEAIELYTKAIELNPRLGDAYCNRGVAYKKNGDIDKAIDDYLRALSLNDDNGDTSYNLAHAYFDKKDFSSAETWYSRTIQSRNYYEWSKPKQAEIYINLGIAKENNNRGGYVRVSQGAYEWRQALRIDPTNSVAINLLKEVSQRDGIDYFRD